MRDIHLTGTGTALAAPAALGTVVLTPSAALSTLVLRDNGAAGTIKLSLQAAANGSSVVFSPEGGRVMFYTDIHATLVGAAAAVDLYIP